ncbi:hypothetical protein FE257_000694 [Aspergillus nanangensis]|uniref:F-box domain-containing protein n=1 Tax=Aspergillus nanangensis TaxID=2582783 RepID=A0AAD4CG30_ASPNN|nr:hypothetical protein FE257_000694 [Aspergillus nanangensis]
MPDFHETLPPECIQDILGWLDTNDLVHAMGVASCWRESARLVLYHTVELDSFASLHLFSRVVTEQPDLANLVREVYIDLSPGEDREQELMAAALISCLPHLQVVEFVDWAPQAHLLPRSDSDATSLYQSLSSVTWGSSQRPLDELRVLWSLPTLAHLYIREEEPEQQRPEGPDSTAEAWSINRTLRRLHLDQTSLTSDSLGRLLAATPCLESLRYDYWIDMAGPEHLRQDGRQLAAALQHVRTTIVELELRVNVYSSAAEEVEDYRSSPIRGCLPSLSEFRNLRSLTAPSSRYWAVMSRQTPFDTRWYSGGPQAPEQASATPSTTANSFLPAGLANSSPGDFGRQATQQTASPLRVEAATGAVSLSIPIHVSAGRDASTTPSVELTYNSHSGNSPVGIGWSLTTLSISRKSSRHVPRNDDADVFILAGAEDLVALDGPTTTDDGYLVRRYGPRVQKGDSWARIERWTNPTQSDDEFWRTISATGFTTVYGKTAESRICDPDGPQRVFTWLVDQMYDLKGDCSIYRYKAEDSTNVDLDCAHEQGRTAKSRTAGRYLKAFCYGNRTANRDASTWAVQPMPAAASEYLFQVVFDYGEHDINMPTPGEAVPWPARSDPFSSSVAGFEVRTYRLCRRVLVFHQFPEQGLDECLVSSTVLDYNVASTGTTLVAVTRHGHRLVSDQSGFHYTDETLPTLQLRYSQPSVRPDASDASGEGPQPVMVDTSQFPDLPRTTGNGNRTQWLDLDGEGSPGLFAELSGGEWAYMRRETQTRRQLASHPRDGWSMFQAPCYSLVGSSRPWQQMKTSSSLVLARGMGSLGIPNVLHMNSDDADSISMDLAGSGRMDQVQFMQYSSGRLRWYPSLGLDGFAAARTNPGPFVPRDEGLTAAILLADMTGDGLTDAVHVRAGDLVYWPNLGHGRFGPMVRMDNMPELGSTTDFNVSRVRLIDVDGSGCADLVYFIPGGGAAIYFSEYGNSWTDAVFLPAVPDLALLASIEVVDILGRGLPCLCWTLEQTAGAGPARLYYLEVMGETRPRLLTWFDNGAGAEAALEYAPSTQFYLQDERNGRPWSTRLPFPVVCVANQSTVDRVAETKTFTRYAYHDGYYDPDEREFHGFGSVDTWESEDLATGPALARLVAPPRYTRTWFHTGSSAFSSDIKCSPNELIPQLQPCTMPANATTPAEIREAMRAMKGQSLRSEVYAGDGSSASAVPLVVHQCSYTVVMEQGIQPIDPNEDDIVYEEPHGRYRVLDRESLQISYEGNVDFADARIDHQIYLATNSYWQCTRAASIQYGRINPPGDLDENVKAAQQETILEYVEHTYTNAVDEQDAVFLPLGAEERHYRLRGAGTQSPSPPALLFSYDMLAANECAFFTRAIETPYELDPGPSISGSDTYKVLLSTSRTYYRSADMTRQLGLGQVEPYSTLDQTYTLSVTPGLVKEVFGDSQDAGSLHSGWSAQDGAYVDLDKNGSWWIPSAQLRFCGPSASEDPTAELHAARSQFYIPGFTVDPYGHFSEQKVDQYTLLATSVLDSVGNVNSCQAEYTTLQPTVIVNANGNRVLVAYDSFGCTVGAAAQGKPGEGLGDSLDNFSAILSPEDILSFLADPVKTAPNLLGSATWLHIYNRKWGTDTPVFEAELRRDKHASSLSPQGAVQISISITYFDGRGHAIQSYALHSDDAGTAVWRREGWSISSTLANRSMVTFLPSLELDHQYCSRGSVSNLPACSITIYDVLDRAVATLSPDDTWHVTTFDAWMVKERDAGDLVLIPDLAGDEEVGSLVAAVMDSHRYLPTWYTTHSASTASPQNQATAQKSQVYSNTPDLEHVDAAGRTIGWVSADGSPVRQASRLQLDVAGNATAAFDSMGREVMRSQRDLCGRGLYEADMDGGPTWLCPDALGREWLRWRLQPDDSKATNRMRLEYDGIGRVVKTFLQGVPSAGVPEHLIITNEYGETQPNAASNNLRNQLYCTQDQAGMSMNITFDFKGNCITHQTQFASDYKAAEYDACGRPVRVTGADGSVTRQTYNVCGFLKSVSLARPANPTTSSTYISDISYNAAGQRVQVTYGNGLQTKYVYDPLTLAEVQQKTWKTGGQTLRDLQYTYDCLDRQVYREDAAQQDVFFRNGIVRPVNDYTYDALGQLVVATGREQTNAQTSNLTPYGPRYSGQTTVPGEGRQMCNYSETFAYDDAGNITSLKHEASDSKVSGWTRDYFYEQQSLLVNSSRSTPVMNNRLSRSTVRGQEEQYTYDSGGCMTSMPGIVRLSWDYLERLSVSTSQRVNQGVPETTWYVYDASGARVRKVTERAQDTAEQDSRKLRETYTLGVLSGYEIHREYTGTDSVKSTKNTIQIRAGGSTSVALVEDVTTGLHGLSPHLVALSLIRYQIDDGLEVDDHGQVISLEEYSPHGATTFRAVTNDVDAPAKYRFAGYPRDTQETGFFYCQARYYAAWLGRWTSPDHLGVQDGLNVYCYVGNDPVNFFDPTDYPTGERLGVSRKVVQFNPGADSSAGPTSYHYWGGVAYFSDPVTDSELGSLAARAYNEMAAEYGRLRVQTEGTGLEERIVEYREATGDDATWGRGTWEFEAGRRFSSMPSVLSAFAVGQGETVHFASSLKRVSGPALPRDFTYGDANLAQLISRPRRETSDEPERTVHRRGACGEILALNAWLAEDAGNTRKYPEGRMISYGRSTGKHDGRFRAPFPTDSDGWGCESLLGRLGVNVVNHAGL